MAERIRLKCPKCGNIWSYKGTKKICATCSDCRSLVKIQENKIVLKAATVERRIPA